MNRRDDRRAASLFMLMTGLVMCLSAGTLSANPTTCTQAGLSRTVEIIYAEPGQPVPCEVIYAKPVEGTIEMLWQAMNEAGYCEAQTASLVEKLEKLGWRCSSESNGTTTDQP